MDLYNGGRAYICLFLLLDSSLAQSSCPPGSIYNTAHMRCYWPSSDLTTFEGQITNCAADGGTVVRITDSAVLQFIRANIPWTTWFSSPYDIYLGLYDVFDSGNFYDVEDIGAEQTYLPWSNGAQPAPIGYTPDQDCGVIDTTYKFQDKSCSEKYRAICSKAAASSADCPSVASPLYHDSLCFWGLSTSRKAENQLKNCLLNGGTLAVIKNAQYINKLKQKFSNWFGTSSLNVYVGYNDFLKERSFRQSYFVNEQNFFNWANNEPTASSNERCVEMWYVNGEWNNLKCSKSRPTICEKYASTAPIETTSEYPTTQDILTSTVSTVEQSSIPHSTTSDSNTPGSTTDTLGTIMSSDIPTTNGKLTISSSTEDTPISTEAFTKNTKSTSGSPHFTSPHPPPNVIYTSTGTNQNNQDICYMAASECKRNFTWSEKEIKDRLRYLTEYLRIHKNTTAVFHRTKYSAYEDRYIARSLGYVGITVILCVVAFFILLDVTYRFKPKEKQYRTH